MSFFDNYRTIEDLPHRLPIFPLGGALLLPRADLPLNIFETRYLEMITDALAGDHLIGVIQPALDDNGADDALSVIGCVGRITSYTETPDGRMLVTLTGICRFTIPEELDVDTPYRQVLARYDNFAVDLVSDWGANEVNRPALLTAFRNYLEANNMSADWQEIDQASTEVLVNTLSLLAPYPAKEKQALLEAPDLKTRADVLVALTEIALAKSSGGKRPRLQ
jgi:uncharacterized protein